jgi:site-specific DNA-methyltransferase (adenine-specific)
MNRDYNYIALGDCVELMKEIPDDFIDLTVTSPPYDNLRDYDKVTWTFEKFKEIAKELFRITKPCGVVVWVVGDATINGSETGTSFRQALYFKEIGFNLHDTMIYQKDSCPFPETNRYYPAFEYMFIFSKGKPKTVNLIADKPNKTYGEKITGTARNSDGTLKPHTAVKNKTNRTVKKFGVRTNVWLYSVGKWKITKDKYAYKHPAMFPEQLAEDHILTWSNPGDIVFDPFLGSGTTAKMAVLNDRKYIGFEVSKAYFDIACQRLADVEYPKFFSLKVQETEQGE